MDLLWYVATENGWKKKDIEEYLNLIRKSKPISILERFPDLSKTIDTTTSLLNEEHSLFLNLFKLNARGIVVLKKTPAQQKMCPYPTS